MRNQSQREAAQWMMGDHYVPFCYREGESLHPEELALYALLKLTGCPLYNKNNSLVSDRETVLKYNATVVCNSLKQIFNESYHKEDLYSYLCQMKSLTKIENPSKIGFLCGQPRDVIFAPYVKLLLGKAALPLSIIITEENQLAANSIHKEATGICKDIVEARLHITLEPNPSIVFNELWLSIASFPGWKHDQKDGELLLWKPLLSRPYMAEKVIRIFEDLHWEIEVPGKKINKQLGLASCQSVVENILRNVDRAYVCQGLPKSHVPDTYLAHTHQQHNITVLHDAQGAVVARDNGDFMQAESCQGLVMHDEKRSDVSSNFPKVCLSCVNLIEQLKKPELAKGHKVFESETLGLIAKLNSEISERKQQITNLWEKYSALRETNRKLEKKLDDAEQNVMTFVTVDGEWLEKHHQQVQELWKKLLSTESRPGNKRPGQMTDTVVTKARKSEVVASKDSGAGAVVAKAAGKDCVIFEEDATEKVLK